MKRILALSAALALGLCLGLYLGHGGAAHAQEAAPEAGPGAGPQMSVPQSIPGTIPGAMTGAEFDAYTQGQTFVYGADGAPYGMEEYLPDRKVRWSFLDGHCQEGRWHEQADQICFDYEGEIGTQCWSFVKGAGGLTAYFRGPGSDTVLYEMQSSGAQMQCLGPEVGV